MATILVLGGTGMLGAPAVRRMVADGHDVRLLVRKSAKAHKDFGKICDIATGDVADTDVLQKAMIGCDAVHVSVGGAADLLSAQNAATAARKAGLSRIGYVSGSTVSEANAWYPMTAQKVAAEEAVRDSGVPYSIFCPTWPMEQLPRFARDGKPTTIGKQRNPYHWFAAEDMGRMVSKAYATDEAANGRFYIHGPEALTISEALARYCDALYPGYGKVSSMPIWLAKLMGTATGNDMLKYAAGLMAYFEKAPELGDPTEANRILGAPTTTLDDWIAARQAEAA